ncbi:MAG: nucleoside triphosphate pyrophosphohydrolase [Pseudomonadota bacterium]
MKPLSPKAPSEGIHTLSDAIQQLADIMAALRHPETGCPWDIKQTSHSIAHYTLEEAYEVVDAIERGDDADLCDELGDLLLQVVFHAQMAKERGAFTFTDVARGISTKMIRRHPHVFDDTSAIQTAEQQTTSWEAIKAEERRAKAKDAVSLLDGVASALPALMRAQKLQKRAAEAGFDWPDPSGAKAKLLEELEEMYEAQTTSHDKTALAKEAGDLLFSAVNYVRKLGLRAEDCLRDANAKFERRFKHMEDTAKDAGHRFDGLDLETQEGLWQLAKTQGKLPKSAD